jgi:hypothetical protein
MKKQLLLIFLFIYSLGANAERMYQWIDADTSTTQLSGKPPHWYRSEEPGPRVVVFENGRAIDDTGIELSVTENKTMRQQALIIVEQDRIAAMEKLFEAQRQKALFDTETEDKEEPVQIAIQPLPSEVVIDEKRQAEADAITTAQQMRDLLEQFEALKTQKAIELLKETTP